MGRISVPMPAPDSAVAGQTSSFKLPIGRRYHWLTLTGSATAFTVDQINEIRVMVNNAPIQRFKGAEREAMNLHEGRAASAVDAGSFSLIIPFDRYGLLTRDGEQETALNTGSKNAETGYEIRSLSIELDLDAGITGTISLSMLAEQSESLPGGPGTVPHILRQERTFSGTGEQQIADLPRSSVKNLALERLFMKYSANDISSCKVELNQYAVFNRTKAQNNKQQIDGIRVPQPSYFVIDRTEHGYGGDPIGLVGLDDFRVTPITTGALTLTTLACYLGQLGD